MYANDEAGRHGAKAERLQLRPLLRRYRESVGGCSRGDGMKQHVAVAGRHVDAFCPGRKRRDFQHPVLRDLHSNRPGRSRFFAVRRFDGDCHLIPAGRECAARSPCDRWSGIRDRKPGSLAHAVTDAFKNDTVTPVQIPIGEAGKAHAPPRSQPAAHDLASRKGLQVATIHEVRALLVRPQAMTVRSGQRKRGPFAPLESSRCGQIDIHRVAQVVARLPPSLDNAELVVREPVVDTDERADGGGVGAHLYIFLSDFQSVHLLRPREGG